MLCGSDTRLPAGFLPVPCGTFPDDNAVDVHQNHPLFRAPRTPNDFRGKCGLCEFNKVCGGSRSRAFAATGDALGSDPDYVYVPEKLRAGTG